MNNPRREFLKGAAAWSATALALPSLLQAMPAAERQPDEKGEGFSFLFQGDSITDGNRSRNSDWNHVLGHGYAYLIASRLGYDHPAKQFHFFNRITSLRIDIIRDANEAALVTVAKHFG